MKLFKRLFIVLFALTAAGCANIINNKPVDVNGIKLNYESYTLQSSSSFQLEAYVQPSNATNKNVIWSVQRGGTSYVSISQTGLVTAKAEGTAKIIATTEESGFTATCVVTVVKQYVHAESVSLNKRLFLLNKVKLEH